MSNLIQPAVLEHSEPLNETEYVLIFTVTYNGRKFAQVMKFNLVYLESKDERKWKQIDRIVEQEVNNLVYGAEQWVEKNGKGRKNS